MTRHKITVICDHGSDNAGLALALLTAVLLLGSGAAAAVAHALLVLAVVAAITIGVLAGAAVTIAILVRRRRARRFAAGALPPPWQPVVASRPAPWALHPARPAARRAAIQAPQRARAVIPGRIEDDPVPARREGRHARPPQ